MNIEKIFKDPITDVYNYENYDDTELIEDYDGYDSYDDYEEIDHCDVDNTVYDLEQDETCKHSDFKKLTPIDEIKKLGKNENIKQCCSYHGYLYVDRCEVKLYYSKYCYLKYYIKNEVKFDITSYFFVCADKRYLC